MIPCAATRLKPSPRRDLDSNDEAIRYGAGGYTWLAIKSRVLRSAMKLPHVIKEGFIHKEGHNIRKMKKRYFKLLIDIDCNPVLEYYDELDTDRRLGLCNLSASTMNKPKNSRPPFVHCLRIDLIDHAMNAFVKLVLGWESQAELDDWVQAFKTASTLITAHRQGSVASPQTSTAAVSPESSERSSTTTFHETLGTSQVQSPSNAAAPVVSSSTSTPVTTAIDDSSSSQSPGGAAKSYQKRGSITVGNNAAAEKREQEKADAEAEKRSLIEGVARLTSSEIENLMAETERNLAVISGQERFNPRKQTLEEVLPILKEKLAQTLLAEKVIQEEIARLSAECQEELTKSAPDASLPSRERIEIQQHLGRFLARLQGDLQIKAANSSPTSVVQAYESNIQAITARVIEVQQFEEHMQSKLKNATASKLQLLSSIGSSSAANAMLVKSQTEDLLSKENNPEIRGILAEMLTSCAQKLDEEARLDSEALKFVEIGSTLKKYARDKVIKKSKHEPVSSVVKCLSASLIWGSHKTGPKVHHVAIGPSDSLSGSGILGQSSNAKLHFHVSVADGSSNAAGRETIDFTCSSEEEISKWVRALKKLIS